jgi:hypothetical protein
MAENDADNRLAKWAALNEMRRRLMAGSLPEQLGPIERAIIERERVDGLFECSVTSLPVERMTTAQVLIIEPQAFGFAIIDGYEDPDRFREALGIKARFSNVSLFERGHRLCIVLTPSPAAATPLCPTVVSGTLLN